MACTSCHFANGPGLQELEISPYKFDRTVDYGPHLDTGTIVHISTRVARR